MQLLCEHFPGAALSLYRESNGSVVPLSAAARKCAAHFLLAAFS